MRGLWLLPSRKRIKKLTNFFESAIANGISTNGVVLVQKQELAELRSEYDGIRLPEGWLILPTNADGLGDKLREIYPAIKDFDWIGFGCDDLRPQTPNWDTKLLEHINGKNIVSCNDTKQGNMRMAGITVFSGALIRAIGYLYPPNMWHTYFDNMYEDIGRACECWKYVDDVVVLHDHPFTNQQLDPAKTDDTTNKSYGQQPRDLQAYQAWIKNEREAVIARIKAL